MILLCYKPGHRFMKRQLFMIVEDEKDKQNEGGNQLDEEENKEEVEIQWTT